MFEDLLLHDQLPFHDVVLPACDGLQELLLPFDAVAAATAASTN